MEAKGLLGLEPQWPPMCFGRQGRAGGAVSRAERRPPTCFGSKRCANNKEVRPRDYSRLHLGSASDPWRPPLLPKSWPCRCQRTVAAGAALEASLSHPPALRLGPPFGGGWAGIPPELPQWRPMCFGSKGGGWVGQSLEHNKDGQRALAATLPPTIGQRVRPRDGSKPHPGFATDYWRPPLLPKSWLCRCQRTLAARVTLEDNARPPTPVGAPLHPGWVQHSRQVSPTHPPCGLALLLGAGGREYLLSCHSGGQRALAARGAGGWGSCPGVAVAPSCVWVQQGEELRVMALAARACCTTRGGRFAPW
jgi:hypothetical protein